MTRKEYGSLLNTNPKNNAVQKVTKAVSECGDLISALECVGAMYGIPPSNIIADDTATSIRVVNDNIIAPPMKKSIGNTKAIVCAIGGVLDYISQRIDDKLSEYQLDCIAKGNETDAIANANPAKGKCIGRYIASDGSEILAYDTGLVDMPNSPAAAMKVKELRMSNVIPNIDLDNPLMRKPSYFSDEDDITNGVDMNASPDVPADTIGATDIGDTNNMANNIQESCRYIDLIDRFNGTTNLGYELLKKQGFDYVKPIQSIVQEADDNSKRPRIKPEEIKHMKFDNTNIQKAIEFFNAARDEQSDVKNGKMDIDKFINSKNYQNGINCLNKQFNTRINLRWFDIKNEATPMVGTSVMNDIKNKLTISKSKGFQLGGLPIDIVCDKHAFENMAPNDLEIFGQNMVSIICHEIFHNIACVMRRETATTGLSLMATLNLASNTKTVKDRRIIISNYVNSLDEQYKGKLINKIAKKQMIKNLMALASIQDDEKLVKEFRNVSKAKSKNNDSDTYIDNLIKKYKKEVKKHKAGHKAGRLVLELVATAGSIVISSILPAGTSTLITSTVGFATWYFGLIFITEAITDVAMIGIHKKYSQINLYEEYYCDLFAGMYQLPIKFFVGISKKKYTPNDFDKEKVNELAMLEKEYYQAIMSSYPTTMERSYAGVKIAKKLLENKDLDSETRKYCQWIVDNFSSLETTQIEEIYNKTTFNPKEADDLDKHLEELINDNEVVLTESFIMWLNSDK